MVFVDDNPAECEQVRRALHGAGDPASRAAGAFVRTLQDVGLFDTLSISDEDRRRGALYRQRSEAEAAR